MGTGHSTAAHRSLRSLPPALEPGIKEASETGLLSGLPASSTKTLSGVPNVKKGTFRPGEARIFKHLPPECQQNYDDWCVCREYTLVGKNGGKTGGSACTSTLESVNLYSVCKPGLAR